jgi:peptide/nickel transport system substrate-binding protein
MGPQIWRATSARSGRALLAVSAGALALVGAACGSSNKAAKVGDGGVQVRFLYPNESYDPVRSQIGLLLTKEWGKLGIKVSGKAMDFAALTDTTSSRPDDFDTFISGYSARPERLDPDILLRRGFTCEGIEGGTNFHGYCDKQYDGLIAAQAAEFNVDKRRALVYQAQEKLQQDLPALALYQLKTLSASNTRKFASDTPYVSESSWVNWLFDARPLTDDRVVKMGQTWDIESTNPVVVTDGGNTDYLRLIYDTLTRVTNDGETINWAAEKIQTVNPTTIKVKLRSGMKFHDGRPVTAEDVAFSYKLLGQAAIYKPFVDRIKDVKVDDDLDLTFTLAAPYSPLFTTTFSQILILPKHIWAKYENSPQSFANDKPIGSGPFKWDYWRKGQEVSLKANPDHFHAPKVDFLGVVFGNLDAVFQGMTKQEIDINQSTLLVNQWDKLPESPFLTGNESDDWGVYYLGFNLRHAPFNDPAFRKAIAYTIPYDTIVKTLFDGHALPGAGFVAPANKQWHNPKLTTYPYDPAKARAILKDAGYTWDGNTLKAPAGKAQ